MDGNLHIVLGLPIYLSDLKTGREKTIATVLAIDSLN
jgi:hypothetical protein